MSEPELAGTPGPAAGKVARPKKFLPTERVGFAKQLELLRAYGILHDSGDTPVSVGKAGAMASLRESSASLPNAFFQDIGLLVKGGGGFTPAEEVVAYARAYAWEPATAAHKLRPLLEASWFGQALMPRLRMGPKEENQAITILAETVAAAPEFRPQLKTLLDYLQAAGSIEKEGSLIRVARSEQGAPQDEKSEPARQEPPPSNGSGRADFIQDSQAQVMRFNVSFDISMAEISRWPPDRISAFFSGIAAVMAAKGGIEKGGEGG